MNPTELLSALHTAERLKDTTRHCCTSRRRPESVAGHSWRIALMAYWMRDEFPEADMDKVIRMCLIHDLGECFTGDIPTFRKTAADEADEERQLLAWVDTLPAGFARCRGHNRFYSRNFVPPPVHPVDDLRTHPPGSIKHNIYVDILLAIFQC